MEFEGLKIIKPVNMRRNAITSRYHDLRMWGVHGGTDFAPIKPKKMPMKEFLKLLQNHPEHVYASSAFGEEVVKIEREPNGFGLYAKTLVIDYPIYLYYAHLQDVYVEKGQILKQQQIIGLMGNTGNCRSRWGGDGTHLHHEGRRQYHRDRHKSINLEWYYKDNTLEELYPAEKREYGKLRYRDE